MTVECPSREVLPQTFLISSDKAYQVCPANPDRRAALVMNLDPNNPVSFVRGNQGQIGDSSFSLAAGAAITLRTAGEVYLRTTSGISVQVQVLSELGTV